jgi:hypothetical protein
MNLETQGRGGRLGIGRNGKVDEIGHADLPVSKLVRGSRAAKGLPETPNIEIPV